MGSRGHGICLVLLILASAAVYLAGNGSVALWDRDEPRYAQTSRQMLQSGDWVVPRFLDKPRNAKPPMIYWCQAAAMKIFGDNNFAARFPSAIAITLLLIVLSCVLWKPLGLQMTLWTVFIFATSGLTIAAAKMCITDALLLLWVTIGQLCLYAMYRRNFSWPIVLCLSASVGLAGLTKAPLIVQVTTLLALAVLKLLLGKTKVPNVPAPPVAPENPFAALAKIVVALSIVAAIITPWLVMVNHRSSGFVSNGISHNVIDRIVTPLEQHSGPPGYYFLTVWVSFFPWSLLLPLAIVHAVRHRSDPRIRFALAAILGPWIMFECIRTKLPHYLLPIFPPLAYLTADAVVRCLRGEMDALKSKPFIIAVGIWAPLVALAASATWLPIRAPLPMPIGAMITLSIVGIIFGASVFTAFRLRRPQSGLILMGLGTFSLVAVMYLLYLPKAEFLRLSPRLAQILIDHGATHPHDAQMLVYMEPSLAFAQGGSIRESGDLGFGKKFESQLAPWLVLPQSVWDNASPDLQRDYDIIDKEFGLAYADRGKWIWVMVIHHKQL
jgi:4-amino-4-deoxy-L-arabinose transferase-like glycosyltransferase